ncbi:ARM repeat superfamily protein isoform X1 [Tasmannia lanceolata]|uniref:ARM repeat superfamily protein isoform X1 n=1 Tax=Tasmannia lanceolata TaxID=3420 RepID=UPI0040641E02
MRRLASQLRTYLFGKNARNSHTSQFSSFSRRDELSIEEEAERKVGWLLKLIFAGTASYVAYQFFPYMGENLLHQSVSLLQVKDPLFKRIGASRLSRFAIDDERRMKIVEIGGAQQLLNMLEDAKDDRTRKEALKALVALSFSDAAVGVLHQAGAIPILNSTEISQDVEVVNYKSSLLKRLHGKK